MYKFKSRATGDLIMLDSDGRHILTLLGKADAAALTKGIILPQDMPGAIAALRQAIVAQEAAHAEATAQARESGEAAPKFEPVSLRQRAQPFINMLDRCHKAGHEIVWGV